jgi:DNA primase DnaG DnaB-binding
MDALRQQLSPEVLKALMDTPVAPRAAESLRPESIKRKTAVQKVINVAIHFPGAAARTAGTTDLELLNQPGADVLRRVFAAAASADGHTARVLESLRGDPAFSHLERIVAEPPLGIDSEEAAIAELTTSLEGLDKEAKHAANVQRIMRGEKPEPA